MTPHPLRIRFTPVELKARHDGWTAARQRHFIDVLAATKSLTRACQAVGKSRTSAYKLRDRPEARQFRLAWDAALRPDCGTMARKLMKHGQPTSQSLETLETLETYVAQLRAAEQKRDFAQQRRASVEETAKAGQPAATRTGLTSRGERQPCDSMVRANRP